MRPLLLSLLAASAPAHAEEAATAPSCLVWHGPPVRLVAPGDFDRRAPQVVWTSPDSLLVGFQVVVDHGPPPVHGPFALIPLDASLRPLAEPHLASTAGAEARLALLMPAPDGAWTAWTDEAGSVVARPVDARGEPTLTPQPVASVTQDRPAGSDLAGGGTSPAHLAWSVRDHTGSSSWAVAPLARETTLLLLPELPDTTVVEEVALGGEATWLVWRGRDPGLWAARWSGEAWTEPTRLHDGSVRDLRAAGEAVLHAVWRDPDGDRVLAGAWAADGPVAPPVALGTSPAPPDFAVDGEQLAAAWATPAGDDTDVVVRVSGPGAERCAVTPAHPRHGAPDGLPAIALRRVDGHTEGVVAWERLERDGRVQVWGRRFRLALPAAAQAEPEGGQQE